MSQWNTPAVLRFRSAVVDFVVSRSALIALAVFLVVGVAVLDDYGVSWDEASNHKLGYASVNYILGGDDAFGENSEDPIRFYGPSFEILLVLIEYLLGLEDTRNIHLTRHLLIHLFFLAGGFFCSLLVYRLFNSRLLAFFALLLFLLHPRLYAHSFFNPKDLPFLSMFMIVLYLIHLALRRDTIWAFLLLGVSVGLLINMRIMGLMLFLAVLSMRVCDLFYASGGDDRKHILTTMGGVILASVLTLYGTFPFLWSNPLRFVEVVSELVRHPNHGVQLFQGEFTAWPETPPHYLLTWIAITTPPVALLLGLIGAGYGVYYGIIRPGDVFRNTTLRFWFLCMACLMLSILAVVVLNSNIYDGWRQMAFLYVPLCLLGVFGLHCLVSACRRTRWWQGVYILVGIGMVITVVEMILIHPHQMVYFNFLVDRSTPEYLRTQYDMEYWGPSHKEGLEYLLKSYQLSPLSISSSFGLAWNNRGILPYVDRRRVVRHEGHDFYITNHRGHVNSAIMEQDPFAPVIYTRKIYNNTILTVTAVNLSLVDETTADIYREVYLSTVSGEPVVRSDFDIYLDENTLTYVKEPCAPSDTHRSFFLHVVPDDADDLLDFRTTFLGLDILNFDFGRHGVRFDGKCLIRLELPKYQIRRIISGQWIIPWKEVMWSAVILPLNEAAVNMSRLYSSTVGVPIARSGDFDLYLDGKTLLYVKTPCSPTDTRARFFLHIYPTDLDDLPDVRKQYYGFENRDFYFYKNGARSDGKCIVMSELPEYPIALIKTGQDTGEGREVWVAEFVFPE